MFDVPLSYAVFGISFVYFELPKSKSEPCFKGSQITGVTESSYIYIYI